MSGAALTEGAAVTPPKGFDAVTHVTRSLASVPLKWEVEVLLELPVDQAARRIPATLAELVEDPSGTLLRMRVSSLDWMARILAGLDCGFTIREPDELRASVRGLADRLVASVS
jgi:predicted DNA-binding transcriptional regulator YafY